MKRRALLGAALLTAAPSLAQAQSNAGGESGRGQGDSGPIIGFSGRRPVAHLSPEQAAAFAKQIERDLAARQARLAIVFRTGMTRDRLPDGISYTHGAFWAYVPIATAAGETVHGYAVYNLYHGDGDSLPRSRSYLHQDFPIDFTHGSAVNDVGVIVPSPEMQRRILMVMASPTYQSMHVADYSLVSNPLDARYQNCTEFLLDVVAAATWETGDYNQIKANLREHFTPTRVRTNLLQRLFGPMADERLRTADQSGSIQTATYESMAAFMRDNALLQDTYVLERSETR